MATITTIFGLAPLVFLPGAGSELYRGVGAIVLFGLLFATMVTLVFLPAPLIEVLGWRKRRQPRQPTTRGRKASLLANSPPAGRKRGFTANPARRTRRCRRRPRCDRARARRSTPAHPSAAA